MVSDELLIDRARKGNLIAVEQLFRRYHDRIYGYLYRLIGNRELAEDAMQETFIRGLKGIHTYKEKGSFKSWLFKIAYREGLRILKREKKRLLREHIDNEEKKFEIVLSDPALLPRERIINREKAKAIQIALDKLPIKEKQVVLLRIYEDLQFKEIAKIMGCPLNTALGRMHNALKRLKKEITQKDI